MDEYVLGCQLCGKTCVFLAYWGPDLSGWSDPPTAEELKRVKVRFVKLMHPREDPRTLHEAAPAKVRDLFHEGARCEAVGALRAAAGMYRTAVEELCRDKQAAGNNLFERIDGLAAQGVPAEIVADLHEARFLGNWSLHDGLSFSAEEVADVALLTEEAVMVVYVQPDERAAMREQGPHDARALRTAGPAPGRRTCRGEYRSSLPLTSPGAASPVGSGRPA
ncbi:MULTISPECIES: DUF4145 domain-containing protein [Streptomyces]|uniref:DUF4145 domain-containing protein n=2 Tax=Streptomyces TaxID=1883 RepID=UPI001F0ECBF0|nr:DUF4145 domain-containing protein [Streptomyces sp. Z423-1]